MEGVARMNLAESRELQRIGKLLRAAIKNVYDAKHMGAFILGFCAIDWMSCFYFNRKSSEENYVAFMRRFMKMYDAEYFYKNLRNGLVHNYTDHGRQYDFREHLASRHLKLRPEKGDRNVRMFVLNLASFRTDLTLALRHMLQEFENDPERGRNAILWFRQKGLMYGGRGTV